MPRLVLILPSLALLLLAPGAHAARTCSAPPLSCATNMPIGGYCECTAHGRTVDGTVIDRAERGKRINSTAGGCGAHPDAPGCR